MSTDLYYRPEIVGGVLRGVSDKLGETISLSDVLTEAERADVESGTNSLDITARIGAVVAAAPAGAIIDATMLMGTVTLTADPFDGIYNAPVTFKTSNVTFKKNFNAGPIFLPSNFHWIADRTELRPLTPITAILTDASPASAMLMTKISSITISGNGGSSEVTLTYASDGTRIVPGAIMGIQGINEYPAIQHTLNGAINASATIIAFNNAAQVAATIGNSNPVYLKIDSEILQVSVMPDGATATVVVRGALGTTAAQHSNGAGVMLMSALRYRVLSVAGTRVTLSDALPRNFSGAIARVGAYNARLSGDLVIDGEYAFDGASAYVWLGLSSVLSCLFDVTGRLRIKNCPHGGFLQMGCSELHVQGHSIVGCGRPTVGLGSSIWSFGGGSANRVNFQILSFGSAALVIDNKSFGVPAYGLIDGESNSVYDIGVVSDFDYSVEFSGAKNNTVTIDRLADGIGMPMFDNAVSSGQTTQAVDATGNVVIIHNTTLAPAALGTNASNNAVIVNGTTFGVVGQFEIRCSAAS